MTNMHIITNKHRNADPIIQLNKDMVYIRRHFFYFENISDLMAKLTKIKSNFTHVCTFVQNVTVLK